MRTGIFQIVASAAVVVYATLAGMSGLDRIAATRAVPSAPTGWAYDSNASQNAAKIAVRTRDWTAAKRFADQALLADPVSESRIGLIGLVRLAANDEAGAKAAFLVSARRGWRDVPTHLYWLHQSVALGDMNFAGMQGDALLRGQADEDVRARVIDDLLQYQEGRDALVPRLRANPPWAIPFASGIGIERASIDKLAGRAEVIARAGPGLFNCGDTAYLINRLMDAAVVEEAQKLHAVSCPQASYPLNDPNFVFLATAGPSSELDWLAHLDGDVEISPVFDPAGHKQKIPTLHLLVSRASTTLVLSQPVILPKGTYRISWKMPDTDPSNVPALAVNLDCDSDLANAAPGTAVPGQPDRYAATFRFDGSCPGPTLGFWLSPGKEVNLAQVRLMRLEAGAP